MRRLYSLPSKHPIEIPQQLVIDPEVLEGWNNHWHLYWRLEEESQKLYRAAYDRWNWDTGSEDDRQLMDDCDTLQKELHNLDGPWDYPWDIHEANPQSVRESCDRVWHAIQMRNDTPQDSRQRLASRKKWERPEKLTPWMKLLETVYVRKHFFDESG
jgi:hypothetical protein